MRSIQFFFFPTQYLSLTIILPPEELNPEPSSKDLFPHSTFYTLKQDLPQEVSYVLKMFLRIKRTIRKMVRSGNRV